MPTHASPKPEAIRKLRLKSGLTQTQAAALIYTPMRTWQDWEAEKSPMHPALWELFTIKVKQ